jgi:hypothetical protein
MVIISQLGSRFVAALVTAGDSVVENENITSEQCLYGRSSRSSQENSWRYEEGKGANPFADFEC